MKARFYDPDLGQFLSQDSFEGTSDTPPSLHKYLYAAGNPVIYVDANGNFFILGDVADGLADLRNRSIDAAGSLSNNSSARGFNRVAAGFAGVGAGLFGVLEGGARTANFIGNLAVDTYADANNDSFFVKDARDQLDQSIAAISQAVETIKENPKEVGTAIVNSVVETGAGVIEGDPGAIASSAATLSEIVGGGGIAGGGAKLAKRLGKQAANGVEKVVDATADTARRVTQRIVENAMQGGPARGSLAAQRGFIGFTDTASDASVKALPAPPKLLALPAPPKPDGLLPAPSNIQNFYHAASESAVEPIKKFGFRTDIPNPQAAFHNNRFGRGVYLANTRKAALAERPNSAVLRVEADIGKNLNIIERGPIYDADLAKGIARGARKHGFDSITTKSVRDGGDINTVIFDPSRTRAIGIAE